MVSERVDPRADSRAETSAGTASGPRCARARATAKPGDIFTPEARPVIKRLLASVFGGPDGKQLKASIMDEAQAAPSAAKLTVNGRYPDTVPLTSVPPQVLQTLPKLANGERATLTDPRVDAKKTQPPPRYNEGTLVDAMMPTLRCWRETLEAFGHDVSLAEIHRYAGMDADEMLARLLPRATKNERHDMIERQGAHFREEYLPHVPALPGARALLQELKQRGHKVAIATDCERDELRHYLELAKVDDLVDAIGCGDDIRRARPNDSDERPGLHRTPSTRSGRRRRPRAERRTGGETAHVSRTDAFSDLRPCARQSGGPPQRTRMNWLPRLRFRAWADSRGGGHRWTSSARCSSSSRKRAMWPNSGRCHA